VRKYERSRSKFRGDEKEDAERADLRIAAHIPADKADDGLKFPFREGLIEVVHQSVG
jgi:hypothetical protein